MTRNFKKFIIYSFTVLLGKLVYDVVMEMLPVIKSTHNPYYDVLIGMGLTLIVFYPLYGLTHKWMEVFSGHYVKQAKKLHRNNLLALVLAYLIGLLILFGCFMMVKFDINIIKEALKWVQK